MACDAVTDIVVRESGRYLSDQIFQRLFATSPWFRLVRRGTWPDYMGVSLSNLTYERSAPTQAEPTWQAMTVTDGAEGGSCLPPVTKVAMGSTTRTFQLYRRALEGPDFCAEDLRYSFALARQLDSISEILAEYSGIEWDIRDRHEYFKMVKRKVAITTTGTTDTFTEGTTSYPTAGGVCAGGNLTLGVLDKYKMKLIRDGAGISALGREFGAPILTVIVSAETFESLKRDNAERREDLRFGAPNELLTPFGVPGSLWGYYFIVDPYPRRFTCSSGVYTEVPAFSSTSASKGVKSEVNSDYETAPYEESFIFDPTVFTQLIPQPISGPAANFTFDPISYTGRWEVMNIRDRVCNPDGNIIFHRGILAAASEPLHPERGVAFVHRRCDPPGEITGDCTS